MTRRGRGGGGGELVVLPSRMAGSTSLIMQADILWGELWYRHAASDMGSGPQGCSEDPGFGSLGSGGDFRREAARDGETMRRWNELEGRRPQ